MLRSWCIENFKPIVDSGELTLAPVTVLAGLNSSGKSSLLQSILMISQTLSSRVLDRPLLPSGPIVRLGTFEDILNDQSNSRTLTVSFELDIEEDKIRPISRQKTVNTTIDVRLVKATIKFTGTNAATAISSAIEAAAVTVEGIILEFECQFRSVFEDTRAEAQKISLVVQKIADSDLDDLLKYVQVDEQQSLVPYGDKHFTYLGEFITDRADIEGQYLVSLSHFLPNRLIRKYNLEERFRNLTNAIISNIFEHPNNPVTLEVAEGGFRLFENAIVASGSFQESLRELCKDENISKTFSGESFSELVRWLRSLEESDDKKQDVGKKLQELLLQHITRTPLKNDHLKDMEGLEAVANTTESGILEQTVTQINRFFTSKIRYLGPLREDPQSSQKFAPSSELDDVGPKGEYAAAVYDANQNARLEWYNPFSKQTEQGTLKVALDGWTRYLGVANQIKTDEAGQSGFSWQVVHKEGQKALPLTSVGVGVSQVLPILVMGLLSPTNTLLIVEQPELHLHARVQARLGEFFVGLSKCKKQCLIETHSENLVNQLRYHIVQSGGQDNSGCKIYFVDQDEQGATQFEPVEISPQGNILNWPEGFFDETMHQEDEITAASLRRRAKLVKNG